MTKEEILEYIFLCISYKHNNDISPYITKSACEKENLLFENAIEFLDKLENENAELKTKKIPQLERKIASIRGCHSVDAKKLNARIEQVERLKKENVEVREELTKAKDLIRNLLRVTYGEGWNYSLDWKVKAEQFLREIEK